MNSKTQALSIASIAIVFLVTASIATPFAFAQNNQTETLVGKLQAASGNTTATAAGEKIFVVVCPPGTTNPEDCQVYRTIPQ